MQKKKTTAQNGLVMEVTPSFRLFSGADYLIFLLVLLGCVVVFVTLPPLGLTSNDEGTRYIQMKNFVLFGALPIEYPGEAVGLHAGDVANDNDQDIFIERNGKLYVTHPPLFTYLSSLAHPLVGERVTTLLPLAAFLACVIIMARVLKLLVHGKPFYYILLFGFLFASPIYPFAIRFVEHVPAVCLALLSLCFLVRYFRVKASLSNLCLSGSLLSVGLFFRPEILFLAIPFTAYVSITLCVRREIWKAGAVLVCSLMPILVHTFTNYTLYGTTLLLHLLHNVLGVHFSRGQAVLTLATLILVSLVVFMTWRSSDEPIVKERVYAFLPALFVPFLLLTASLSPVPALFLAFPLVLLTFFAVSVKCENLFSKAMSLESILFATVTGFLLLVSWLCADNGTANVGYCLGVIPFVIVLVAQEEKRIVSSKLLIALVLLLLLCSACYAAYSVNSVTWRYKQYNAERIAFLKAQTKTGDVVMVDSRPRLEHAGPLFFERVFVVTDSPCKLSQVGTKLKEKGVSRAYLWAGSRSFSMDSPSSGPHPLVFSSTRGPENYLYLVGLVPLRGGTGGGPSPSLTSCTGGGPVPRLQ